VLDRSLDTKKDASIEEAQPDLSLIEAARGRDKTAQDREKDAETRKSKAAQVEANTRRNQIERAFVLTCAHAA